MKRLKTFQISNCAENNIFFIEMLAAVCYNSYMKVRVKAYAKLNLTLSVTGVQNGYHMLDSLVCSVDLYDLIVLKKRKDRLVTVEMHGRGTELMPFEENNAAKAARLYSEVFKTCGADIKIYKNIPLGAGMGGSSADAAGVIRGMGRLYGAGSEKQMKELCDGIGSDTGYMLGGGYARLTGRGEKVLNLNSKLRLDFLLLVPKNGVSTAECYKKYDCSPVFIPSSDEAVSALMAGDKERLGKAFSNALYAPAAAINPDVEEAYKALCSFSPLGLNMTGSGSGVFALFETPELCEWAKSRYRGGFECIRLKTVLT